MGRDSPSKGKGGGKGPKGMVDYGKVGWKGKGGYPGKGGQYGKAGALKPLAMLETVDTGNKNDDHEDEELDMPVCKVRGGGCDTMKYCYYAPCIFRPRSNEETAKEEWQMV